MKKILVVDDNEALLDELTAEIKQDEYFSEVFCATSGKMALEIAKQKKPDIILTDMAMPNGDGIWLLENLKKDNLLSKDVTVVFMMELKIAAIEKMVMELGAHYFVMKPFDYNSTMMQIKAVADNGTVRKEEKNSDTYYTPTLETTTKQSVSRSVLTVSKEDPHLEQLVTNIFHELGMPAHIKGYEYLRYAILRVLENRKLLHSVTKELYPMTAKEFDSKPSRVERAIRHAIEVAWTRGDSDNIAKLFGCTVLSSRGKPTNSEFLAMIADRILLKLSA